jgi:hypothetical protein
VPDYLAKEQIGPIEAIDVAGGGPLAELGRGSTEEHMLRSPFTVQRDDRQGRAPSALLDYTEGALKERFFTPVLKRWTTVALLAGLGFHTAVAAPHRSGGPTAHEERDAMPPEMD